MPFEVPEPGDEFKGGEKLWTVEATWALQSRSFSRFVDESSGFLVDLFGSRGSAAGILPLEAAVCWPGGETVLG